MILSPTFLSNDDPELLALIGGPISAPAPIDQADVAVAVMTGRMRGQIVAAANAAGVGVRELARRLHVSPAAVSRHLRSEGDMRVSTCALFAHALGLTWKCELAPLATVYLGYTPPESASNYRSYVSTPTAANEPRAAAAPVEDYVIPVEELPMAAGSTTQAAPSSATQDLATIMANAIASVPTHEYGQGLTSGASEAVAREIQGGLLGVNSTTIATLPISGALPTLMLAQSAVLMSLAAATEVGHV
jgi:AcrR family transcriptional regulator